MAEQEIDTWEEPPQTPAEKADLALAEALAHGKITCHKDLVRMAKALERPIWTVERKARSPKVKALMGEEIQYRALCHVAQRLDKIAKLADTKGWAWKALCQIATVIPVGGVSITSNTLIDARVSGSTASVQQQARQFHMRLEEARAARQRGEMKLIDVVDEVVPFEAVPVVLTHDPIFDLAHDHDPPGDEPPPKDDPEPEAK